MKKRIVCMILSLVLLVSLLPMTAITASAAERAASKDAIRVLKVLQTHKSTCNASGIIGYGTACPKTGAHGSHIMLEYEASAELEKALAPISKAINTFASSNGISLSQNQHDALVLFSFQNGTAWTQGTGDFQRAIVKGTKGNEFLNVICNWKSTDDNSRRMIEADMYLNGSYSATLRGDFITVTYKLEGGKVDSYTNQYTYYYDTKLTNKLPTPTKSGSTFVGWYNASNEWITKLSKSETLTARWQTDGTKPENGVGTWFTIDASKLADDNIYKGVNGTRSDNYVSGELRINLEFIDENGIKWLRLHSAEKYHYSGKTREDYDGFANKYWVKFGKADGSASVNTSSKPYQVKVTVTNSYVRCRANASIYSAEVGKYYQGDVLRIVDTKSAGGYLWGRVIGADHQTIEGYVALMYTNYEDAVAQQNTTSSTNETTVTAKALVTVNGYVNVRDGAGTHNNIVGALRNGAQVDLYDIKYVNGQQWGKCSTGWFCLAYANVTNVAADKNVTNDVGYLNYIFYSESYDASKIVKAAGSTETAAQDKPVSGRIKFTNLTAKDGKTWGQVMQAQKVLGWMDMSDAGLTLSEAKYVVISDTVTVRANPNSGADRVDILKNDVEFHVSKVVANGSTVWGYTDNYKGWVNLSNQYVSNGVKVQETDPYAGTYTVATVIDTPTVNVRQMANIFAAKSGSLTNGTTVKVLEGPVSGPGATGWYRLDVDADGDPSTPSWVSARYLNVFEGNIDSVNGSVSTSPDGTQAATGRGVIANTYGGVNVRTAPGTGNAQIGKILPGTAVDILEVKYHGETKWGRVEQGWICMDYVSMIDYDDIPVGGTGSGNSSTTTSTAVAIYTGKVNMEVNIRKETSLESDIVRTLAAGEPVTVHEILVVEETNTTSDTNTGATTTKTTSYWARVNDGYIKSPGDHITLDSLEEEIYTVTGTETLNVRAGAGTSSAEKDFKLKKGDQVAMTEVQIVNGGFWGYFDESTEVNGWISLAYMTKGAVSVGNQTEDNSSSTPEQPAAPSVDPVIGSIGNTGECNYSGKIIGTDEVNVRKEATTNSASVTKLKRGTAITITKTTIYDGRSWGYCGSGWVNLVYVDLTPVGSTAIDAKVVDKGSTMIYSDNAGTDPIGTYTRRAVVNIYEELNGMYKTDLGWVDKDCFL